MILWLLTICLHSYALKIPTEIRLELGEDLPLKSNFTKIWIEDKTRIAAHNKQNKFYIKTLRTGTTYFRLDNQLNKIIISPLGSKKTFADWEKLSKKFVDIEVAYCGPTVCLKGNLYRTGDYLRIVEYIKKYDSNIFLALNVEEKISAEMQMLVGNLLRLKGLTPLQIQFGETWKIYFSKAKDKKNNSEEFRELGIQAEYSDLATAISDNVKVAVKVVEISKNFERKLGVRWPDSYQAQVFSSALITGENSFEIAINAAEKSGEAKILASPNLICRSGKEADFFAGGEFPIKVLGLHSKEILWKRYGIGLKLKPLIDPLGQMSLQIETEVSTLDRSITVDDIPALHTNRVSSFFDLISSRTIAISGLIKSEVSENSEGIPFLKNLPVLGALFTSKNFQENKSELVIFVTPELLH